MTTEYKIFFKKYVQNFVKIYNLASFDILKKIKICVLSKYTIL